MLNPRTRQVKMDSRDFPSRDVRNQLLFNSVLTQISKTQAEAVQILRP